MAKITCVVPMTVEELQLITHLTYSYAFSTSTKTTLDLAERLYAQLKQVNAQALKPTPDDWSTA